MGYANGSTWSTAQISSVPLLFPPPASLWPLYIVVFPHLTEVELQLIQ